MGAFSNLGIVTGLAFSGGKTTVPFGAGAAGVADPLPPLPSLVVFVAGVVAATFSGVEPLEFVAGDGEAVAAGDVAFTSAGGTGTDWPTAQTANRKQRLSSDMTLIMTRFVRSTRLREFANLWPVMAPVSF
jgi:hypothetical protein